MYKYFLLLLFSHHAWSSNILLVGLTISHSHHFWIETIALGLVDKGHNVTYLSIDHTKVNRNNYTVITLDGPYEKFQSEFMDHELDQTPTWSSIPSMANAMWKMMLDVCTDNINHKNFHKLLTYPKDHFKIILWDHTMGECLYPLIDHFGNPPLVGLSPYGLTDSINHIYKAHVYPYVGTVTLHFAEAKSIHDRLFNVAFILYNLYRRESFYKHTSIEISRRVFPNWDIKKYEHIEREFNLVLLNWNVVVNQPQPLAQNLIPIGGVQIKTKQVLSQELKLIFERPSAGIIYFSLGSNFKSEKLSPDNLQSIIKCFTELNDYQIIWKIESPKDVKLPANVNTVKFAPQTAILAQPKTKLFITHGGGLSTQETSYYGVPIVGIPIFLDQMNNIEKLRIRGGGEVIKLKEMKAAQNIFCDTVKKVLLDEMYENVMTNISKRYQEVQNQPLDTAIYWVEYVLKYGDAKHLRPLSYNMNVFYSQNLDIYSVFILLVTLILIIVYTIVRCIRSQTYFRIDKKKMN